MHKISFSTKDEYYQICITSTLTDRQKVPKNFPHQRNVCLASILDPSKLLSKLRQTFQEANNIALSTIHYYSPLSRLEGHHYLFGPSRS